MVFSVNNMNDDELVAILLSTLDAAKKAGDSRYFSARDELLRRHQTVIVNTLGRYGIPSKIALDTIEVILEKLSTLAGNRKRINFKQFIIENAVRMSKQAYAKYKTYFIRKLVIEGILTAASVFLLSMITINLYFNKQRPEATFAYITGQYIIEGKDKAKTVKAGDTITTRQGKAEIFLRNRTIVEIDSGTTLALNTLDPHNLEATLREGHVHAIVDPLQQDETYKIHAGDASISVIGTEFDITRIKEDVKVSVVHGRVRVVLKDTTNESWPEQDFVYSNQTIIPQTPLQQDPTVEPEVKTVVPKQTSQKKVVPAKKTQRSVSPVITTQMEDSTVALSPITIQAEDYDSVKNMKVIDSVEGKGLGYIYKGSKASFIVKLPKTGFYKLEYRVSCPEGKGKIKFNSSDGTESVTTDIVKTGAWETWKTVEAPNLVPLKSNSQELQIEALGPEFNFNWFRLTYVKPIQ